MQLQPSSCCHSPWHIRTVTPILSQFTTPLFGNISSNINNVNGEHCAYRAYSISVVVAVFFSFRFYFNLKDTFQLPQLFLQTAVVCACAHVCVCVCSILILLFWLNSHSQKYENGGGLPLILFSLEVCNICTYACVCVTAVDIWPME